MRRLSHEATQVVRCIRQMHVETAGQGALNSYFFDAKTPTASGAHAKVYWARHRDLEHDVAIKVMSPFYGDWQAAGTGALRGSIKKEERVFDELLASGEIHPNVVDVISRFKVPGNEVEKVGFFLPTEALKNPVHFFVTEYLGGGSLEDVIAQKKASGAIFEEHEVLDVALSVSEGLRFLHEHGVVHRDVKPANLVYSDQKELKLIDFSLAGVAANQRNGLDTAFRGNMGTEGYVAPEVLRGGGEDGYGPSCDIFSLGCTLHEMLVGEPPTVELRVGEPAKVVTRLPQERRCVIEELTEALLAVEPSNRPTASDVVDGCKAIKEMYHLESARNVI